MTAKQRKPMTFDVDRSPPTTTETAARPSAAPPTVERQQVGARIPVAKYRQLKARAALEGVHVQTLVEQAIDQFLASRL
jgi:predicted DNA binding CopG/RHH family protein